MTDGVMGCCSFFCAGGEGNEGFNSGGNVQFGVKAEDIEISREILNKDEFGYRDIASLR